MAGEPEDPAVPPMAVTEAAELFSTKSQLAENYILLKQLQSIIDFSYDGIYVTNRDGTTLCVNKSYERITGVRVEEVIGKNIEELEYQGMFSPIITPSVIKSKERITLEQTVKTGKKVIITGNPVIDENGEIIYVITNVRDMTEIEQLKEEIDKLKTDQNLGNDAIVKHSAVMRQVLNTA
ncbi:MAG: PAS domain S-box protein, partial [Candidatus Aminicenantes bacterium]